MYYEESKQYMHFYIKTEDEKQCRNLSCNAEPKQTILSPMKSFKIYNLDVFLKKTT